jgi:hypothetical protein
MKDKISRKIVFFVILLGFALVILVFSYQRVLIEAGRYLSPRGMGKADVAILEGAELIKEKPVKIGMGLLSSGVVSHLVVVVRQKSEEERNFALSNYTRLLTKNLEGFGLKKDVFRVIEVPTNHPVTLTEAKIVLSLLSKSGVRSVILVAEGFHTRRSFWAYKQVGADFGVRIISQPYFTSYRIDTWWKQNSGVREFGAELIKFVYYLVRGYIPLKSLLVT